MRLRARGGEDVPHDGLGRDVRDLREVAVPEAGLEHEVPHVWRGLAGEEPEQGALPRAVRADEGDLVPRVEEEVGVLEDERGAPGFPEVPARDDRLHFPRANPWSPMRLRPGARMERAVCDDSYILLRKAIWPSCQLGLVLQCQTTGCIQAKCAEVDEK